MLTRAFFLSLFCPLSTLAATDLGKILPFKMKPSGQPAFGIVYTYGDDPDGTSYLLTFTANVSASEGARKLRWNYYLKSKDTFLLEWSKDRMVTVAILQILLKSEELKETIETMIRSHKGEDGGTLYFILADEDNKPVYNVSISELCGKHPDNFKDLSYERRCDDPKL